MSVKERYIGHKSLPYDIQQRLASLPTLFQQEGVKLAYLFGSFAKNKMGQDVDLAVLYSGEISHLRQLLAEHLKTQRIDLVDLKPAPLSFKFAVLRDGKLIYKRNSIDENDFELEVLREYQDIQPIYEAQNEILKRRLGCDH